MAQQNPYPAAHAIALDVAKKRGVHFNVLVGKNRSRCKIATFARHEVFWRCRDELELSFPEIGAAFGYDHTAVLQGSRRYAAALGLWEAIGYPRQWLARKVARGMR
jgi:chromosomal replication initiation ATPase DnaA